MTDERVTSDPDGLSFFTEHAPHDQPTASVFGGSAAGRLDDLFAADGADDSAPEWTPTDEIRLPTAPLITTSTQGHTMPPIVSTPAYTGPDRRSRAREQQPVEQVMQVDGFEVALMAPIDPDANRDFILNGPRIDRDRKRRGIRMSLSRSSS